MKTTKSASNPADDQGSLALLKALLGIPAGEGQEWLARQIGCRISEALRLGATEDQATTWASAWADLVGAVITWPKR